MRENLTLAKGGRLLETKWVYDKTLKEGSYVTNDVTDSSIRYLFEPCLLEPGARLKDVFLLLNNNLDVYDAILGNWCKELVTEGLTKPEVPYNDNYDPDGIEYLELDKTIQFDNSDKELYGLSRAYFGGIGFELQEDRLFEWGEIKYPKGHRIPWSLSFTSCNKLINYPLKLNMELKVANNDYRDPNFGKLIASYPASEFTLGDILHSIIWELSFYGGPAKREQKSQELREAKEDLEKAKAEGRLEEYTVPAEQVFKSIDNGKEEE